MYVLNNMSLRGGKKSEKGREAGRNFFSYLSLECTSTILPLLLSK